MNRTKIFLKIIKLTIILIPVSILIWICNKQFVPFGKSEIKYDFNKKSPFISDLYPAIRTSKVEKEDSEYFKKIHEDGVYFDLTLPRLYKKATVQVKFNSEGTIFDIGARKDKNNWQFEMKPLENKIIDRSGWAEIRENNLIFLQKNVNYKNVRELTDQPFITEKIGTYYFNDYNKNIKLEDYKKSNKKYEINNTLRGPHLIYTYIKDENLDFIFYIQDINRDWNADPININVYKNSTDEKIYTESIDDDGEINGSGKITGISKINIKIPNLEEGIYRVELNFNNDLLTRKIETKQKLLVFARRLFIADSSEYIPNIEQKKQATTFYSSGKSITVETNHPNSLQTINVNDKEYIVDKINDKLILGKNELSSEEFDTIQSSKGDLLFESNGYYVFSLDAMFYPRPPNMKKLDFNTDLNEIDYIIANYQKPESLENNWKIARAEFDLGNIYIDEDHKIQFLFSAPGLRDQEAEIKINEIKMILEKEPITSKNFIPKFKNLIKRIKF